MPCRACRRGPEALEAKRERGKAARADVEKNERIKAIRRASYWRNREKTRAAQAAYYKNDPVPHRKRSRQWARSPSGKAKIKTWLPQYREANREKIRERAQERLERQLQDPIFREAHNRQRALVQQRRRVQKLGTVALLTAEEWALIVEAHGHCCIYCGRGGKLTIDHVKPLSRGGQHAAHNVVPACRRCNARKHNSELGEALARLGVDPLEFILRRNVALLNLRQGIKTHGTNEQHQSLSD